MREIKFRGKRFYSNKWVYGSLFIDKDGERYILENNYLGQDGHHLVCNSDIPVFMMEETIGQYTGLRDKNGKEIFEGDIVCVDDGYNDKDFYTVKYFDYDDYPAFDLENYGSECNGLSECMALKTLEVIGNIYDNPELLQK